MSYFQGLVIALLVLGLARSYANGHDIRGDWSSSEQAVVGFTALCATASVSVIATLWVLS